jgi:hypothetical protein
MASMPGGAEAVGQAEGVRPSPRADEPPVPRLADPIRDGEAMAAAGPAAGRSANIAARDAQSLLKCERGFG